MSSRGKIFSLLALLPSTNREVAKRTFLCSFFTILVGTQFLGCTLNFRESSPPSGFSWPVDPRKSSDPRGISRSVNVSITPSFKINGEAYAGHDYSFKDFMESAISGVLLAYKESGLFSDVTIGKGEADWEVEIKADGKLKYDLRSKNAAAHSFWIFPYREITEIHLLTIIRDKEGNTLGEFEQSDTVESWTCLLLFPFFPIWMFVKDSGNYKTLIYDVTRWTIIEAREKVVF